MAKSLSDQTLNPRQQKKLALYNFRTIMFLSLSIYILHIFLSQLKVLHGMPFRKNLSKIKQK